MPIKAFLSKPVNALGLLTAFYVSFMFLPRLMPEGMFVDGLLYSSIARNLAEGRGSWWLPFFSHGYWIEGIVQDQYYENPPLMFWMQSVFFRILGDHWWVEKLYATLLLAFNFFLIIRIWKTVLKSISGEATLSWLPVLFFYLIPIVFWGSAYNLMDSQLLTFCLLAVWALVCGVTTKESRIKYFALAVVFIFLGILTKGPVAIYPVAFPFFYFLVFDRSKWIKGVLLSGIVLLSALALLAFLLFLHPPALHFFEQYWHQRLSAAIMGGREEGIRFGIGRLYVLWILLRENSVLIIITLILVLVSLQKKMQLTSTSQEKKWALVFLCLGFAGTVPLALSTRQAGMYLIPSLVMFPLAASLFHYTLIQRLISGMPANASRIMAGTMIIGIIVVAIYSVGQFGIPARDKDLLGDIHAMESILPVESFVGVGEKTMSNGGVHVYLQRYLKLYLTRDLENVQYAFLNEGDESLTDLMLETRGFKPVFKGKKLSLYKH